MIKAVVFDMDDTLYSEIDYVFSGFSAISEYFGDSSLCDAFKELFNIDRKNVFQRMGLSEEMCNTCVEIYRNHIPNISLSDAALETLLSLKAHGYKLGMITDGVPEVQKRKILSLGLDKLIDEIIITDELGGLEFRKPDSRAFCKMKDLFKVSFDKFVYVGDNPSKDFYIKKIYSEIHTVRFYNKRSMYYSNAYLDNVKEDISIYNIIDLKGVLRSL